MTGTAAGEVICGLGGNDTLVGMGGSDVLLGGAGTDTASYASNPSAITADLLAGTVQGASTDHLDSIENVIGSPFADVLRGDGRARRERCRQGRGTGTVRGCEL